jgi:hypothetical protein
MHNDVKKYAESNDITMLRYIFGDCLTVDPTFEKYRDDYEYCKSLPGMFDSHQELHEIVSDRSKWTKEYWEQLSVDLSSNFSKERFEHMIEVAKIVYADKVKRLTEERKRKSAENNRPVVEKHVVQKVKPESEKHEYSNKSYNKPDMNIPEIKMTEEKVTSEKPAPDKVVRKEQVSTGSISPKELQDKKIQDKIRKLDEENKRIEEKQAAHKDWIESERRKYKDTPYVQKGSDGSKKALGIVLGVGAIVVVAVIIKMLH